MKISVDNQELLTLSETQKKVLKNDIHEDVFSEDMKRRLQYIVMHKYEQCFKRLKDEWEPKLKKMGVTSIPLNDDAFAEFGFSMPQYKNRKQRDAEEVK